MTLERLTGWCLAVIFVAGVPQISAAQNEARSRIQVEKFSEFLQGIDPDKVQDSTLQTRDRATQWLKDARVLLADGQEGEAQRLLKRVELAIELIQAEMKARRLERKADMQQKAYYQLKNKKLPDHKERLEQLKEERQRLREKLQ